MTVQEKVGQLFVVNAFGQTVADADPQMISSNQALYGPAVSNFQNLIDTYHVGGFIYFDWSNNLNSPAQIVGLSNGIQRAALSQRVPVPMLISTDQEQGEVLRIGTPATVFPGNMALGATRRTRLARRNAVITGRELRAMGVNVDNAPVVDVNLNQLNSADGIRAFGDRVPFVSRFAVAQVNGYQSRNGVGAVAKHWPGLGDTSTNPDTGVTVSDQTVAQLKRENFPPFEAAIDAGVSQVMVTHIVMPNVDPSGVPSSLSYPIVSGLLRQGLGYDGPVVTDALNAQALNAYSAAEIATMAIAGGDDELLQIAGPGLAPSGLPAAYQAVLAAVAGGQITNARLDQSVTRILRSKWDLGLAANPFADPGNVDRVVGTPKHLDVARRTSERSITVLKNRGGVLPLRAGPGTRALVTGWGQTSTPLIANELASRRLTTQVMWTGQNPSAAEIRQAQAAARRNDLAVVNTFNVWSSGSVGQIRLVKALLATGKPVIVLAIGTPYDIAYFPKVTAFVAAYDYQQTSIDAAVAALFGRFRPTGRLPVTITRPPPSTAVLYPFGSGLSY